MSVAPRWAPERTRPACVRSQATPEAWRARIRCQRTLPRRSLLRVRRRVMRTSHISARRTRRRARCPGIGWNDRRCASFGGGFDGYSSHLTDTGWCFCGRLPQSPNARWVRRLSAWSPNSQVDSSSAVADAEGHATFGMGPRSCRRIGGPAFLHGTAPDRGAQSSFANHVLPYDMPIEPMTYADFCTSATRAPRSALGTDGVLYPYWAYGGDEGLRMFYHADLAVVDGDAVPASFNQAWLVLIIKAPIALDTAHVAHLTLQVCGR